jgi:hypothetical protein
MSKVQKSKRTSNNPTGPFVVINSDRWKAHVKKEQVSSTLHTPQYQTINSKSGNNISTIQSTETSDASWLSWKWQNVYRSLFGIGRSNKD